MAQRECDRHWKLELASSLAIAGVIACPFANNAFAQLKLRADTAPSRNLGTKVVPLTSKTDLITGGTRPQNGSSLFHSFAEFNVRRERDVYFDNPAGVKNIFSRVTGKNPSNINGKLGVQGGDANLFLINPNGIIFESNARLDLQGSFLASTASSLNFDDRTRFSTISPQAPPLLKVSAPIGLQFGKTAADIHVKGSLLQVVQPDKTLGLVGGDVTLESGVLSNLGGRIELGSVTSNNLVSLNATVEGWSLGYEETQSFQNIRLRKGSFKNTSQVVATDGDIQVQGRQVMLADASQISAEAQKTAANLTVTASESVQIRGGSGLASYAIANTNAGNTTINTKRLLLTDGAFVATESLPGATGGGGSLIINASESVELTGSFLSSGSQSSGSVGDITIKTGRLLLRDGAQVSALSLLGQSAGNITINADILVSLNNSDITANATEGEGGFIQITAQGIFGLEVREPNENTSDISAISQKDPSLNGVVEINTPDVDPDEQVVDLPEEVVDVSELVAQSCSAGGGTVARGSSEFVITGRGGLPPTPGEAFKSDTVLVDLGTPIISSTEQSSASKKLAPVTFGPVTPEEPLRRVAGRTENRSSPASTNLTYSTSVPVTEAQGWVVGPNGEVVLTAQAPIAPHNSEMTSATCHGS